MRELESSMGATTAVEEREVGLMVVATAAGMAVELMAAMKEAGVVSPAGVLMEEADMEEAAMGAAVSAPP
jgi:hypothetical protein